VLGWRRTSPRASGAQGAPSGGLGKGKGRSEVEFPQRTEAVAERSSMARGFPVRKVGKFWSSSCSKRRESYWGGWIGWRRGGGMGSTGTEAYRRGGSDGEVVPVGVRPRRVAWECQWGEGKYPRGL
jgi:hypothetical protein